MLTEAGAVVVHPVLLTPDRLAARAAAVRHKAAINLVAAASLGKVTAAVVLLTQPRTMVLVAEAGLARQGKMARLPRAAMVVMGHLPA